jgi:hypothetical protein
MKEVNAAIFDHRISEKHLHAALTLPAARMDFNHERLEHLGNFTSLSISFLLSQ